MFLSEWCEFPSAPCLAGKKNLMTARVSMLLKSHTSLTCFPPCFFLGWVKDLSAPRVSYPESNVYFIDTSLSLVTKHKYHEAIMSC